MRHPPLPGLCLALLLAGCDARPPDTGPIVVSAIGGIGTAPDANRAALTPGEALLVDATTGGLVQLDAAAQVEPALAERWIVTDDGTGYIFRMRDPGEAGARRVSAADAMRRLHAALKPASHNVLKPSLAAVAEMSAVTPDVIDIRLSRPLPGLLALLALPELAIRPRAGQATGAYRIVARADGILHLAAATPGAAPPIELRGEAAPLAVARFMFYRSDLVAGGTIGTLPLVKATGLPAALLRLDPVHGLYGLVVTRTPGDLADPVLRRALAMAIDGDALRTAADLPGLRSAEPPGDATPAWLMPPLAERRGTAAATAAAWTTQHGMPPRVTITRPAAPGDRLMVGLLARQWRAIGVAVDLLPPDEPAALRLVDEIAPDDAPDWLPMRLTCAATPACDPVADAALAAARDGASPALLAEAARRMADQAGFFALAEPLRWTLVARRLGGFRENPLAFHPLARLLPPPRG